MFTFRGRFIAVKINVSQLGLHLSTSIPSVGMYRIHLLYFLLRGVPPCPGLNLGIPYVASCLSKNVLYENNLIFSFPYLSWALVCQAPYAVRWELPLMLPCQTWFILLQFSACAMYSPQSPHIMLILTSSLS